MVDLRVNYTVLDQSRSSLEQITQALEGATRHSDGLDGIWGNGDVAGAMADFVDNWDRHRGELLESLRSVAEQCGATCDTFRGTDSQLSSELTDAETG